MKNEFNIEIESIGYEVKPGLPEEGVPMSEQSIAVKLLLKYIHSKGDKYNLSFKDLPLLVNSNKALRILEYAKEHNLGYEFASKTYTAYFENYENIALDHVLLSIAENAGLNLDEVKNVMYSSV